MDANFSRFPRIAAAISILGLYLVCASPSAQSSELFSLAGAWTGSGTIALSDGRSSGCGAGRPTELMVQRRDCSKACDARATAINSISAVTLLARAAGSPEHGASRVAELAAAWKVGWAGAV